ncbi:MAG: hypothetical protein IJ215_02650 [Clostridia bacterium]|nr:hypothetical protein [Clostridia bacterium]
MTSKTFSYTPRADIMYYSIRTIAYGIPMFAFLFLFLSSGYFNYEGNPYSITFLTIILTLLIVALCLWITIKQNASQKLLIQDGKIHFSSGIIRKKKVSIPMDKAKVVPIVSFCQKKCNTMDLYISAENQEEILFHSIENGNDAMKMLNARDVR